MLEPMCHFKARLCGEKLSQVRGSPSQLIHFNQAFILVNK